MKMRQRFHSNNRYLVVGPVVVDYGLSADDDAAAERLRHWNQDVRLTLHIVLLPRNLYEFLVLERYLVRLYVSPVHVLVDEDDRGLRAAVQKLYVANVKLLHADVGCSKLCLVLFQGNDLQIQSLKISTVPKTWTSISP